jgi:putative transposase
MAAKAYKQFKYRIYPTKAQVKKLGQTLDLCCELYNAALQERRDAWRVARKFVTCYDQQKQLTEIKQLRNDLKSVHPQVLCETLVRLDRAFNGFFRRVKSGEKPGYPRFRSRSRYNSFTYTQHGFSLDKGKLKLSKIGNLKIKLHRAIEGKAKLLTVRCSTTGKWYACFTAEVEAAPLEPSTEQVGIDCGLEKFATLSTGEFIENPRFLRRDEKAFAKARRKESLVNRRTKEYRKHHKVVTRINERIANRRANFAHQLSRKLVNRFAFIAFEDLDIESMKQNRYLAKSVSDAAWNQLVQYTTYKAECAGRCVVLVDPRNTSKKCSGCGKMVKKNLATRVHNCPSCGLKIDRDHNAAINILRLGQQSLDSSVERVIQAVSV